MATLFSSCKIFESIPKKEARKDNAALQRVQAKADLAFRVYLEQAKLHPCENIITKYLPGKKDSISYPVFVFNDNRTKEIADSVRMIYANDMYEAMQQAARAAYDECVSKYTNQKLPAPVHDTAWYEDTRHSDAWKATADDWKLKYTGAQAVVDQSEKDNKGKLRLQWWMAIVFPIVFLIIGFAIGRYGR